MVVIKGLEIIAKRDKVTYASNISGKWADYSIETHQGKVLKDAFERFKIMLKEGKELASEVPALKEQFNGTSVVVNVPELTKVIEKKKKEKPLQEVIKIKDSFTEKISASTTDTKYVIDAGINKNGYQTYISGYEDDLNYWMLSKVPSPTTKERCEHLLSIALKDIEEKEKNKMLKGKTFSTDFKIVEWTK